MSLNLRRQAAETLTVPPSGERRLLGLLVVPALVLDVVCAVGVAAANEGGARTVLLALLGLCLLLTLFTLAIGPSLLRNGLGHDEQTRTAAATRHHSSMMPAVPVQRGPLPIVIQPPAEPDRPAQREPREHRQYPAELVVVAARRNEVLVSRQLSCLDQLSADGNGSLETQSGLWRVGELATRLRRNGESLLVVAGAETERRASEPMPLSEVISAATAEIENGSRVVTTNSLDRAVRAEHVVPLGHLLAELLENAVGYAFPAGGVRVQADPVRGTNAVRVRIEDSGPGFSDADLERANQRLRNPEAVVTEEIGALDLGLFVVSRLARQVPCTVEMSRAESGGVCVSVDLPGGTFVTGAGARPAEKIELKDGAQPTFAEAPVADYTHYDDHTDLSEYAEMQGYTDLPVPEPEVMPAADDFGSTGPRPEYPGMPEPPAVLADPVAVAGPLSLDQPFGANAPLLPEETQPFDEATTPGEAPTFAETPALAAISATDEDPAFSEPEVSYEQPQTSSELHDPLEQESFEPTEVYDEPLTAEPNPIADDLGSPDDVHNLDESPAVDETVPRRHGRRAAVPQTFFAPIEPVTTEPPATFTVSEPDSPADPLSHPPHVSHPHEAEPAAQPEPVAPRRYPSRAELRRQRRALEEGAEAAMQAGAQAAAQAAQAAGLTVRGPLPTQPGLPRATAEPLRAVPMQPMQPVQPVSQDSVSLLEEVLNRQAREAAAEAETAAEAAVPAQVTPLDDPNFQVPADDDLTPPEQFGPPPVADWPESPEEQPAEPTEAPPIPAQAAAAEDEPGFEEATAQPTALTSPEPPGPREPLDEEPARPAPRHAATGPVPMVSASRSSLAGQAVAPAEATRQRAAHVRAMLAGLRSGSEKGRESTGEPGVPQPRPGDNPER
ncbi:ATP-binding protein [Kineosporia rhizophila]|uniref:sensor histidine kinase n=1 Tax=Kineosporia rhizophila TaxID=84633 RepID=UPI001E468C5F|nr:ATP-binding protein [Kineosporia rhizophila]MCE0537003.1 ATP-binding protein [Kineosporia rhizophila]